MVCKRGEKEGEEPARQKRSGGVDVSWPGKERGGDPLFREAGLGRQCARDTLEYEQRTLGEVGQGITFGVLKLVLEAVVYQLEGQVNHVGVSGVIFHMGI